MPPETTEDLAGLPRIIDADSDFDPVVDTGAYEYNYEYIADCDHDLRTNFIDLAVLQQAWQSRAGDPQWNPECDVSLPPDGVINARDLSVVADTWLAGESL